MKTQQTARNTYERPFTRVVTCQQCLMQGFSRVNTGKGSDLKPEEGTPEDPKLAKRGNLWGFEAWNEYDEY